MESLLKNRSGQETAGCFSHQQSRASTDERVSNDQNNGHIWPFWLFLQAFALTDQPIVAIKIVME
jgi:hypothetical protein